MAAREWKRRRTGPGPGPGSVPRASSSSSTGPARLGVTRATFQQTAFPHFGKPTVLGCFSIDAQRRFVDDASELRAYQPPPPDCDLREGYADFRAKDEGKREGLDFLLRWLLLHSPAIARPGPRPTPDEPAPAPSPASPGPGTGGDRPAGKGEPATVFVTWRGHLVRLAVSPYDRRTPWRMAAVRRGGRVFLSEYEVEAARRGRLDMTDRQREMCYWGIRFEDYATRPLRTSRAAGEQPGAQGATAEAGGPAPIDNMSGYCLVVESRLKRHRLVFAGEVDCVRASWDEPAATGANQRPDGQPPPEAYVELKTSRVIETPKHRHTFERYKALKWFFQSFLIGVPTVVCGFRDDDGVVRSVKTFETTGLPRMVRDSGLWSASVCMNFLEAVLSFIASQTRDDGAAYVFDFDGSDVTVRRDNEGAFAFLPEWFPR